LANADCPKAALASEPLVEGGGGGTKTETPTTGLRISGDFSVFASVSFTMGIAGIGVAESPVEGVDVSGVNVDDDDDDDVVAVDLERDGEEEVSGVVETPSLSCFSRSGRRGSTKCCAQGNSRKSEASAAERGEERSSWAEKTGAEQTGQT